MMRVRVMIEAVMGTGERDVLKACAQCCQPVGVPDTYNSLRNAMQEGQPNWTLGGLYRAQEYVEWLWSHYRKQKERAWNQCKTAPLANRAQWVEVVEAARRQMQRICLAAQVISRAILLIDEEATDQDERLLCWLEGNDHDDDEEIRSGGDAMDAAAPSGA